MLKSELLCTLPRHLELKYCESCGTIWLRRNGSKRTLCASCARAEEMMLTGRTSFLQLWTRFRAEELI